MNRWFHRGNSRRFFRIDMPIKIFIIPSAPIQDYEIYASGINYFPGYIEKEIETYSDQTLYWMERIQEHKQVTSALFHECLNDIEFLGYCIKTITRGLNPRKDPNFKETLNHHLQGFSSIETIHDSAPKTYNYFKMIEEKYMIFMYAIGEAVMNSTPDKFSGDHNLPTKFKSDRIETIFSSEEVEKVPLVQAILNLNRLLTLYTDIYRQINHDSVLRQYPEDWTVHQTNISASGVALYFNKRFKLFEKVDVLIQLPLNKEILFFNGNVVDIRWTDKENQERVAINFDFPDGKYQNLLQNEIQRYEIEECMSIALT